MMTDILCGVAVVTLRFALPADPGRPILGLSTLSIRNREYINE